MSILAGQIHIFADCPKGGQLPNGPQGIDVQMSITETKPGKREIRLSHSRPCTCDEGSHLVVVTLQGDVT